MDNDEEYAVMSPGLNGYVITGEWRTVSEFYERHKESVLAMGSSLYKYILVKRKRKTFGYSVTFSIDFTFAKHYIKPTWGHGKFEWLCFVVEYSPIKHWHPDCIVRDHYAYEQGLMMAKKNNTGAKL